MSLDQGSGGFGRIVEERLTYSTKCYRHCEQEAHFRRMVDEEERIVGAYLCSGGYVSRIVYFARRLDLAWFKEFLGRNIVAAPIRDRDIRVATRHPWDTLGDLVAVNEGGPSSRGVDAEAVLGPVVAREAYWSIRRVRSSEEAVGAFVCQYCRRLFLQGLRGQEKYCPECR